MAKIDIDSLAEEELIELNQKVVARLRFLREMRSHVQMMDFRIGERVAFHPDGRPQMQGVLTRYNKKSVTVITDGGEHWRGPQSGKWWRPTPRTTWSIGGFSR